MLTEPKNAIVRQYEYLFSLKRAGMEFETTPWWRWRSEPWNAKPVLAAPAVMDEFMTDLLYDLPEIGEGARFVVTAEAIGGRENRLADLRQDSS